MQEVKLYNGKMTVRFQEDGHAYFINGERKTGVTTILGIKDKSTPLIYWATGLYRKYLLERFPNLTLADIEEGAKQHRVRKEEAGNIGTEIHAWCEAYILGQNPAMPEDQRVIVGVNAFLDWVKEHRVKFLSAERVLYSKKYDYVGKMDAEAMIGKKRYLIDFKTGNDLYNDVMLQTAAYLMADMEESGREYAGRWAIRLAKETEDEFNARMAEKGKQDASYKAFQAVYLDAHENALEDDFESFKSALTLWRWNKKAEEKMNQLKAP